MNVHEQLPTEAVELIERSGSSIATKGVAVPTFEVHETDVVGAVGQSGARRAGRLDDELMCASAASHTGRTPDCIPNLEEMALGCPSRGDARSR
jgi:hypothetical protein